MKLCILDNDILEGHLHETYSSFGALFIRLFEGVGADWTMDVFNTQHGQYPASFDTYDAVLLTGSRADSFSDEPWVVELRRQVTALLQSGKKMVGVCFGHQLIALCMGAPVGRAPQGWGAGRMTYDWHRPDLPHQADRTQIALLASHQDQVLELPPGATLVASSDFCPVAAFTVGDAVFCIQPHPEFEESLSAHLIDKRRDMLGEEKYQASRASLEHGHEGEDVARMVVAFLEGTRPAP
ncbi:glutamine amidotransferase-related protein [Candidatus Aalborgicola defluviihabitans]|jgi:GMP synthase-like glutamine amidotransferase|uniref:glutamine amidotransferase-related protein n=1 Tax=Candidatus Aalborgicola defluviihabitans TaxID=3386187 RepID=UPI001DCCB4FC|nr:amidotransferase [Burkholderiales bacterium]